MSLYPWQLVCEGFTDEREPKCPAIQKRGCGDDLVVLNNRAVNEGPVCPLRGRACRLEVVQSVLTWRLLARRFVIIRLRLGCRRVGTLVVRRWLLLVVVVVGPGIPTRLRSGRALVLGLRRGMVLRPRVLRLSRRVAGIIPAAIEVGLSAEYALRALQVFEVAPGGQVHARERPLVVAVVHRREQGLEKVVQELMV